MERPILDDTRGRDRTVCRNRPPSRDSSGAETRCRRRHRSVFRGRGPSRNALVAGCTRLTGLAEARTEAHSLRTRATPQRDLPTLGVGTSEELKLLFAVEEEPIFPPEGHLLSGLIDFARFSTSDHITAGKVAERLCAPLFGDFARRPVRLPSELGSMSKEAFLNAFDDPNNIVHYFVTTFGPGRRVALKLHAAALFAVRSFYLSTEAFGAQITNSPVLVPDSDGDDVPGLIVDDTSPLGTFRRGEQHSDPLPPANRSHSRRGRGNDTGLSFSECSAQNLGTSRHRERGPEPSVGSTPFMSDDDFDDNFRDLSVVRRITKRKLEIIGAESLLPREDLASFFRAADRASTDQPYIARKPFAMFVPDDFGTKFRGISVSGASRLEARAARIKAGPSGITQVIQSAHTFWASHAFAQDYLDPEGPAHHCALLLRLATSHGCRIATAYETALQRSLVNQRSTSTVIDLNAACFSLDREVFQEVESEAAAAGLQSLVPKAKAPAKKASTKKTKAVRRRDSKRMAAHSRVKIDEPCRLFSLGKCKMGDACRRDHSGPRFVAATASTAAPRRPFPANEAAASLPPLRRPACPAPFARPEAGAVTPRRPSGPPLSKRRLTSNGTPTHRAAGSGPSLVVLADSREHADVLGGWASEPPSPGAGTAPDGRPRVSAVKREGPGSHSSPSLGPSSSARSGPLGARDCSLSRAPPRQAPSHAALVQALSEFRDCTSLVLDLFAGCGPFDQVLGNFEGARGRSLLGQNVVVISFETLGYSRRVLETRSRARRGHILSEVADTAGAVGSVLALLEGDSRLLREIYRALPNLRLSVVLSGSPHKDTALALRPGIGAVLGPTGPQSFLSWTVAATFQISRDILSARDPVPTTAFFAENDHRKPEWQALFNTLFGVTGHEHDAGPVGPASRQRVTHANFALGGLPTPVPWMRPPSPEDCVDVGWAPAWELLDDFEGERKFAAFTAAWAPGSLPEYRSATQWHLALVAYTTRALVYRVGADVRRLAEIKLLLEQNRISQNEVKSAGTPANLLRIKFVEELLTTSLGSDLRPLNAEEKERCLGLVPGSTRPNGPEQAGDSLARSTLTSNSWSLFAFAKLLRPLLSALASDDPAGLKCTRSSALPRTAGEAHYILQTPPRQRAPAAVAAAPQPPTGRRRRPQLE